MLTTINTLYSRNSMWQLGTLADQGSAFLISLCCHDTKTKSECHKNKPWIWIGLRGYFPQSSFTSPSCLPKSTFSIHPWLFTLFQDKQEANYVHMCTDNSFKAHTNNTHPPERSLRVHCDRIFRVDPLSCGGQVEPWGERGWCSIGVLPKDGVKAQPCCPTVSLG